MEYKEFEKELITFRNSRKWQQYHNLKDLAISLNLEASEVLEIFQWKNSDLSVEESENLKMELADVLIYTFYMCEKLGVEPLDLANEKLNIDKGRHWKIDK